MKDPICQRFVLGYLAGGSRTVREIEAAAIAEGLNDASAVGAVYQLLRAGKVIRVRRGVYALRQAGVAETVEEYIQRGGKVEHCPSAGPELAKWARKNRRRNPAKATSWRAQIEASIHG